jgi:predicted metalloprotease with PDZ domain
VSVQRPSAAGRAPLHYRVELADVRAHLWRVTLTIALPAADQQVSLPVWIPGSYLVREFARHLQHLRAEQNGRRLALHQMDKCSWQVASVTGAPLVLSYEVYAFDSSVRTAWLDAHRGFFNGTSLCLRVHGQERRTHALELAPPAEASPPWEAATGLAPAKVDRRGFGTYLAADYDELVDCPVEMGHFWRGEFKAGGVSHQLVVSGAPASFDAERLLADTRRICETEIRFWHGRKQPPFKRYLFMLQVVDDGYGGLEHRNSTALIAARRDLPRLGEARASEGYTTLLGLISHEYFHTWNVKRLRPAEFTRYDYTQENYTQLLWFFEGFTSYYDDLFLRRCGLIDDAAYLRLLAKGINQVQQAPGRQVQSVAQASYDAWVKYYRQDENTPNATISYYSKGALVALCLDLTLRREGHTTLDAVMRALWDRCQGGPMTEADVIGVLRELGGRSFQREIAAWVHGTGELPLDKLLTGQGVAVHQDPAPLQQRLGLRTSDAAGGVQVKTVLRGGAAEAAGLAAGDEWLGVEVAGQAWRLTRLEDLPLYAGTHRKLIALVARDKRLLRLNLQLPAVGSVWRLTVGDTQQVQSWLSPGD